MYDRIVVPLDGSAVAEAALPWAALLPSRRARLLRVRPGEAADAAEEEAAAYLIQAGVHLAAAGREVETAVDRGDPAERIVAAAADADLLVLSSRGHGAGGRRIFGSVADLVARHAPVPTLLIRGGSDPVPFARPARALVPLDGSPNAERALPVAAALAGALGLPLHVVAVAEAAREEAPPADLRRHLSDRVEGAAARLGEDGRPATSEVRSGEPAAELLAMVRPGDLLVMTTHGGGGAQRWIIGAVAEALVREAPAPVLLVRADAHHLGTSPASP